MCFCDLEICVGALFLFGVSCMYWCGCFRALCVCLFCTPSPLGLGLHFSPLPLQPPHFLVFGCVPPFPPLDLPLVGPLRHPGGPKAAERIERERLEAAEAARLKRLHSLIEEEKERKEKKKSKISKRFVDEIFWGVIWH